MVEVGDICRDKCIMQSIGIKRDELGNPKPFEAHNQDLFSDKELTCITNCVKKVFTTEKIFYDSLKSRIKFDKLTEQELSRRIDDPTGVIGPYYLRRNA